MKNRLSGTIARSVILSVLLLSSPYFIGSGFAQVKSERDDFKKMTIYRGQEVEITGGGFFIRAWKFDDDKEKAIYQIYVIETYYDDNWHRYTSANDDSGNSLDTTAIDRKPECSYSKYSRRSSCSYTEHIGIGVTRKYLEAAAEKGALIKLSGNGGELIIFVPPATISEIVSAVPADIMPRKIMPVLTTSKKTAGLDKRTPEQRYTGAFDGARTTCLATQKIATTIEELRAKNLTVGEDLAKKADVSLCIKTQLAGMATEYKAFLPSQKSKAAKDALTAHYVSAVLAVKGIEPFTGEKVPEFSKRQTDNLRIVEENWVRFELEK